MTSILVPKSLLTEEKISDEPLDEKNDISLKSGDNVEDKKQLDPISLPEQSTDTNYSMRKRKLIDYGKTRIDGHSPEPKRKYGCDQCFRYNSPDIHLGLADKSHCHLKLIVSGKSVPLGQKKKKFTVFIYNVMTKEKTHKKYMHKVLKKVIKF